VVKEVYAALARRLAETRQQRGDRSTAVTYGEAAFRRDLDRARWTLKFALRL
jgi:hypothetical protein